MLDLHSRRAVGFALDAHHDAALATAALQVAIAVRGGDVTGVIFHSDQGGEYTGELFRAACRRAKVRQSMGRTGSALDNAVAESFNSTVEFELLAGARFATRAQARAAVAAFLDEYNNLPRRVQQRPAALERRPAAAGGLRGPGPAGAGGVTIRSEAASPPLIPQPVKIKEPQDH